jgi:hypothetical protein
MEDKSVVVSPIEREYLISQPSIPTHCASNDFPSSLFLSFRDLVDDLFFSSSCEPLLLFGHDSEL